MDQDLGKMQSRPLPSAPPMQEKEYSVLFNEYAPMLPRLVTEKTALTYDIEGHQEKQFKFPVVNEGGKASRLQDEKVHGPEIKLYTMDAEGLLHPLSITAGQWRKKIHKKYKPLMKSSFGGSLSALQGKELEAVERLAEGRSTRKDKPILSMLKDALKGFSHNGRDPTRDNTRESTPVPGHKGMTPLDLDVIEVASEVETEVSKPPQVSRSQQRSLRTTRVTSHHLDWRWVQ